MRLAATVARTAASVVRCTQLQDVIDAILEQSSSIGAVACSVFLADRGERTLRLRDHRGLPRELADELATVPFDGNFIAARAASSGSLVIVDDMTRVDGQRRTFRHTDAMGTRSLVAIPLRAFDDLVGVLVYAFADAHHFTSDERAAIDALSDVFALALSRALLARETPSPPPPAPPSSVTHQKLIEAVASRAHTEVQLRDRERRLRAILDHANEFVGLLDVDGTLLEANRSALDFIGAVRDDVVGKKFWDTAWWSDPVARRQLRSGFQRALRGERVRFETTHRGANGNTLEIEFSLSPVQDDTGAVVLVVPEGSDITERKEAERFRQEAISAIAHDLRQPVSAINLWASAIAFEQSEPDRNAVIDHVHRAVGRLNRMIGDLLDASRIASGHLAIQRERADLVAVVEEAIGWAGVPRERIELVVNEPVPPIVVDAGRIVQVVANLLTNAAKYGDGGAVRVTIAASDDHVIVQVANRGRGIAPDEASVLFQRFGRARSTAKSVPGIGLGLYISRALVEAHGGTISVESVPDESTTFAFTLPVDPST